MRFRLKAFGMHLGASAGTLTLILGGLFLGWYRWPGWYLTEVVHVLVLVLMADLILGPALTLVVAHPAKPRPVLKRDITIIAAVQIVALGYGAWTLWSGRPLYYTYSEDRLEMVQASDLSTDEIARARRENPALAPSWRSLPRWIWAPLPEDPAEAARIAEGVVLGGGADVIDMPRYFKPWADGLPALRKVLQPAPHLKNLAPGQMRRLLERLRRDGVATNENNAIFMWGHGLRLVAVFDSRTQLPRLYRLD
ncbi:MAG: hypothetical protein JSR36_11575 [Proteobacteria bacterium]|nr:hypothetical protein [Pseudomonadota bacterium]